MAKKVSDDVLLAFCLSGKTQTAIAKELGMTKAQICKRIKQPEFQETLSEYRKKVLDGTLADLTANARKATQTLVKLLDDDNPFIQLKAATQILSMTQDISIQKDLMKEIEEIRKENEKETLYNRL